MEHSFKGRILIVDDDLSVGAFYQKILGRSGFEGHLAVNLTQMQACLNTLTFDFVLLDTHLGEEDGLDGLALILKEAPFTKVYVLTAHGTVPRAVEAMRRGASGFFEKGGDTDQLVAELISNSEVTPVAADNLAAVGLIGRSPAMLEVFDKIARLRDVDSMILILGESGTGKEVIARSIHRTSRRAAGRFDAINCGAIPEALLESELFGHKRGAFTDAKTDRKGIFELCTDGTLLLDEIGDMPLALQTKLLRVLQEREITPVGASEVVKVNARVIAATHHDILHEAREKRFREDLYYRLSIVVLHIPPLRQRLDDIPLLVDYFLTQLNRRFAREVHTPSAAVMGRMMAYDWPGNVRELKNAIERAVVLSTNDQIAAEDLFAHLAPTNSRDALNGGANGASGLFDLPLTEAKQAFERNYLEHQLTRCKGHIVEVAKHSGRYRADVYRLLSRYGLDHSEFR